MKKRITFQAWIDEGIERYGFNVKDWFFIEPSTGATLKGSDILRGVVMNTVGSYDIDLNPVQVCSDKTHEPMISVFDFKISLLDRVSLTA